VCSPVVTGRGRGHHQYGTISIELAHVGVFAPRDLFKLGRFLLSEHDIFVMGPGALLGNVNHVDGGSTANKAGSVSTGGCPDVVVELEQREVATLCKSSGTQEGEFEIVGNMKDIPLNISRNSTGQTRQAQQTQDTFLVVARSCIEAGAQYGGTRVASRY
jgi:hypothetical protein